MTNTRKSSSSRSSLLSPELAAIDSHPDTSFSISIPPLNNSPNDTTNNNNNNNNNRRTGVTQLVEDVHLESSPNHSTSSFPSSTLGTTPFLNEGQLAALESRYYTVVDQLLLVGQERDNMMLGKVPFDSERWTRCQASICEWNGVLERIHDHIMRLSPPRYPEFDPNKALSDLNQTIRHMSSCHFSPSSHSQK